MTANVPPEEWDRLLDRTLRELPLRRAPSTLETRVFGELARRAALSWWRRSFAHWPHLARATFLVICGALIMVAFVGGDTVVATVRALLDSGALSLPWLHQAWVLVGSAGNLVALLARIVPPAWAFAGIAAGALLYAVLFGLGAAVYHTLYLQPHNGR
jgi:hypothetical protein